MKDLLEKLNIDQLSEMQEEMVEKTKESPNSDLLLFWEDPGLPDFCHAPR